MQIKFAFYEKKFILDNKWAHHHQGGHLVFVR